MEFTEIADIVVEDVVRTCGSYTSISTFEDEDLA